MIRRFIRSLLGHGIREARADQIMRDHYMDAAPEKRAIKARVAAIERLVDGLQKDAAQPRLEDLTKTNGKGTT